MSDTLLEKWDEMLNSDKLEKIDNSHKVKTTAQLLENTEKFLSEAANVTAGVENFDPVLINLVRRLGPKLIAYDVCGVQAMNGPTGLIFALKARYAGRNGTTPGSGSGSGETPQGGAEALFDEALTNYSGTGSHVGDDPWDVGFATGTGKSTAAAESDAWAAMGVTISKTNAVAVSRKLRADYSLELAQDMRSIHGLDAESELSTILASELIAEINRETVRTIYSVAKQGAQFAGTPGTFDLQGDSDGRWSGERFQGLRFAIERDANAIARETRRGKGNIVICSSDVASALAMSGVLNYSAALAGDTDLDVDATGTTFAGKMGRYKVFVDPYLGSDGYVVGYRGASQYDAGMFYCPYVPVSMHRAVDPETFQPALGFQTRYAIVANPFTTNAAASNVYYRKARVLNLL